MNKNNMIFQPGKWFQAPNDMYDSELLSSKGILVYGYLLRCRNSYFSSFPSYSTIERYCKISRRTVKKALDELEELDLLEIKPRYGKDGRRISNLYIVKVLGAENQSEIQPIMDILSRAPKDKAKIEQAAVLLQQFFNTDEEPVTNVIPHEAVPKAYSEQPQEALPTHELETVNEPDEPTKAYGEYENVLLTSQQAEIPSNPQSRLNPYGHHKFVYLTDEEHKQLVDDYSINVVVDFIDQLDSRIAVDGGPSKCKYAGNYATVRRWIVRDIKNKQNEQAKTEAGPPRRKNRFCNFDSRKRDYAELERMEQAYLIRRVEGEEAYEEYLKYHKEKDQKANQN